MLRPRSGITGNRWSSRLALLNGPRAAFDPRALLRQFNPVERVVRAPSGLPEVLGRLGALEVRLARTTKDIRRCQRLRFKVFHEEMGARSDARARLSRRDIDAYDRLCDHVMVLDHAKDAQGPERRKPKVIGTYRLLRSEVAQAAGVDFYTAEEFDLGAFLEANSGLRLLELGRSCVLEPYRNRRTLELLWHGVWCYILHHRIDLMFGCASFEGVDVERLALPLAFLERHAAGDRASRVRALPDLRVPMNRLPIDAIDARAALKAMPPLIKGYLRLGATFGDGAVIDRQFGTTDVFVCLRVAQIDRRYVEYYGTDASRHAA